MPTRRALVVPLSLALLAATVGLTLVLGATLAGAQAPRPPGPGDRAPNNAIPRINPDTAARIDALRRDVNPRPGESVDAAARRAGLVPQCDRTRGRLVKLYGRDVQLPQGVCINGTVLAAGEETYVLDVGGERAFYDKTHTVKVYREDPAEETRAAARVRAAVGGVGEVVTR